MFLEIIYCCFPVKNDLFHVYKILLCTQPAIISQNGNKAKLVSTLKTNHSHMLGCSKAGTSLQFCVLTPASPKSAFEVLPSRRSIWGLGFETLFKQFKSLSKILCVLFCLLGKCVPLLSISKKCSSIWIQVQYISKNKYRVQRLQDRWEVPHPPVQSMSYFCLEKLK